MDWLSANWYWLGSWVTLMYFGYHMSEQSKIITRLRERVNILEVKTRDMQIPDDAW